MKKFKHHKLITRVQKQTPWISHIVENELIARDLNRARELSVEIREGSLCLACRGSRRLCGKTRCPALLKLYSFIRVNNRIKRGSLVGTSPPGVFVGRIGYPYVYAGPLVPPIRGDTSLFDSPELWLGRTVEEIVGFRTNLIRGKFRVNVKKPYETPRFLESTLDIALSKNPVDTEVTFRKKPSGKLLLDGTLQPMGPSALIERLRVGNSKTDLNIEKAYSDTDLKAGDAILNLFSKRVPVSKIQRAFSIGAFGLKKKRRIVPTRWSITAVDSTISKKLIQNEVKEKNLINEYRVYEHSYLGNKFVILLTPSSWKYEWIEAWYPGTTWNPQSRSIAMGSDWEGYKGRTTYASIGGCYYAVRLAAAEFLARENHQAGVIAMREIHPSFITPLGVWLNRECIRAAFKQNEKRFNTIQEAMTYINSRFTIKSRDWIKTSVLLKDALYQEKISKYF